MKTKPKISRQQKWQIKNLRAGLCVVCGGKLATNFHCLKHAIAQRERMRANLAAKGRGKNGTHIRYNSKTYRLIKGEESKPTI